MNRVHFIFAACVILLVASVLRLVENTQYPPGPHYDEAVNILVIRGIAFDGANMFPITPNYQGRESLYFYLNAPFFRWVDDSTWMMHTVSAFSNLLTIAATMTLGRLMFRGQRGLWIGLIAGVLMTVSFHQVFMGRQAYRAVTLPMMQSLGLVFLWRGLTVTRRGWLWLALGGAFSAGALYTYMASRLFPVWLGMAALVLLWADRRHWRTRLRQGAWFFGVMLLVSLPLGIFAWQNPDIFLQRFTEVQDGDVTVTLTESLWRHVQMFFIHGDYGNLRYNIPGRPYFTWPEAPFLLLGAGLAVWGLFHEKRPVVKTAYAIIALSPLMILPSVVSVAGLPPSHMRSLGMVPLIFLMVAIGAEWALGWVLKRVSWKAVLGGLLAVLFIGALSVGRDYFQWAQRADLFAQADGDLAAAALWLQDNAGDRLVYVGSYHREHPTIMALYGDTVTWLGLDSLVLPPVGIEGIAVFAQNAHPPQQWLEYLQPIEDERIPLIGGIPAFWAYSVHGIERTIPPDAPQNAYITMLEPMFTPIPSGATGTITLMWKINADVPFYSLRPVVRVVDWNGITIALTDPYLINTNTWREGEIILQDIPLSIPPATPSTRYTVQVTWVDRASGTFLTDTDGGIVQSFPDTLWVNRLRTPPDVSPQNRVDTVIQDGVMLRGWDSLPTQLHTGESLTVALYWDAVPQEAARDNVLVTATFNDIVLGDEQGIYPPPDLWQDGEVNRTYFVWRIPPDMPVGESELTVTVNDVSFVLGTVNIVGQPRIYTAPSVETVLDAAFDGQISLYGYTLDESNNDLSLMLVWQALRVPDANYTVFVHLLDADGQIACGDCQRDTMPQNYAYPTLFWDAAEYVVDEYLFTDIPSHVDTIRVGLYDQSTGRRLYISTIQNGIIHDYIAIKATMRNP